MQWKDVSSFSQNATDHTPRTFQARSDVFTVTVSRHRDYPGYWILTGDPWPISERVLKSESIQKAKTEALLLVFDHLDNAVGELKDLIDETFLSEEDEATQ